MTKEVIQKALNKKKRPGGLFYFRRKRPDNHFNDTETRKLTVSPVAARRTLATRHWPQFGKTVISSTFFLYIFLNASQRRKGNATVAKGSLRTLLH